ncbi:AraC family transcriptional regulator [Sinomonas sp. JGH33]|uniref:AraC family transcriptional regulator n=1 Tax=Sinomonas terricola TaxID=3110330 RepID=A0ABU5TA35_9MICC|nr:AraC family transcriptional regulator [Sinomonas sp. JGH33]MEA5456534.1 AraC family transcriptional regulator [Sinomonas sp. JGH33]
MDDSVRVWHPTVPFVREVLHATFEHHVYPAHTHDAWAVLMVDDGAVAYDLDRTGHFAVPDSVTLLPPHVPHNGRSAVGGETYRKRVIYLDEGWLPARLADATVARPTLQGNAAAATVAGIHAALRSPGEMMAAEYGILSLQEIVQGHLGTASSPPRDVPLARRLRQMLDDRLDESFTITEAARILGTHPSHLVRAFSQAYGIAPHRYVIGRRVDLARRLLLAGRAPAEAAAEAGFHDQAHLTRHFRRVLGTTPGTFAA